MGQQIGNAPGIRTKSLTTQKPPDSDATRTDLDRGANGRTDTVVGKPNVYEPVDPSIRRQRIAEAAYYRAEARGFSPGFETEDWLAAEAEIDW